MLHLSSERLAALADSEPTVVEAEHLAMCAACARERAAHRALVVMARGERSAVGMPLTRWDSLAPELHRAKLVAAGALMTEPTSSGSAREPGVARGRGRGWLQAAVVIFVLCGGAVVGRISAGASPLSSDWFTLSPASHEAPGAPGTSTYDRPLPAYRSPGEALDALRRYEIGYQHAAAYLASHDSTTRLDDSEAYRTRLAALDRAGRAMSEALREVPHDPVINGYYLTTLGQREATLRQLETALPAGHIIRSF